jgi:hypothetical protein
VGGAVFKTVEAEDLGLGGSIPLRLRCMQVMGYARRVYADGLCHLNEVLAFG